MAAPVVQEINEPVTRLVDRPGVTFVKEPFRVGLPPDKRLDARIAEANPPLLLAEVEDRGVLPPRTLVFPDDPPVAEERITRRGEGCRTLPEDHQRILRRAPGMVFPVAVPIDDSRAPGRRPPLLVFRERPVVQPVAERNGQLRGPLAFLPVSGDVDLASGLRRPPRVRGPRQATVTVGVRPVLERNDNRSGGRRLRRQARPRLDDERPLRIAVAPEDEEQIVRRVGDFARDARRHRLGFGFRGRSRPRRHGNGQHEESTDRHRATSFRVKARRRTIRACASSRITSMSSSSALMRSSQNCPSRPS